jgi:hypothetical protein
VIHIFKTLEELENYIPNCIICGKHLQLFISGRLNAVSPAKPRWGSGQEQIRLPMVLKEGVFRSKHKNHSVSVEYSSNHIIDGQDIVNRLRFVEAEKNCPTCHFKILAKAKDGQGHKENCLPPLTISHEELHYTMKGGKPIRITKYYGTGDTLRGESATIRIDNKFLPPVPWDFDKFKDLAHLNKRIATIKMFH